jgi:arylsulfatase A-like enzyme
VNVLLVLIDSLNRHDLPAYGGDVVPTPNVERLARRAVRFDNHFVGSLPCMPARRELYAGFKELLWRPWGPLERFDRRLPRLVERAGHRTVLVTDHYHYWEESANGYLQSFQAVELVRGHEYDNWGGPAADDEPVPAWVEGIERWRPGEGRRYWGNVRDFRGEEDFFPARTFSAAAARLEELRGPFFLQVESFDVHEPFHVPESYRSLFGDGSGYDRFTVWPPYQDWDVLKAFLAETTPAELAFVRAQYLAKVALVDRWLGEVFDVLDRRGLWDDTAVILTTDHGHDLAERGQFGKQYPHWDSHANIPLLVWHPEHPGDGRTVDALTQTVDLHATIAELCGVDGEAPPHGRSILPLLRGEAPARDGLLYGTFGDGVCVTDGSWTLFKSPPGDGPLFAYSSLFFESNQVADAAGSIGSGRFIPGVAVPQWQIPVSRVCRSHEDMLFDRRADPGQTRNLWDEEPEERERMLGLLLELVEREGAPPEQLDRLGLG